jgi:hypothetical protein
MTLPAQLQVGWASLLGMKTQIGKDYHPPFNLGHQRLEMGVMNIGRSTVPGSDQPQMVEHQAELASHDPALVGLAFLTHLAGATPLPCWMDQLDTVAVHDPPAN